MDGGAYCTLTPVVLSRGAIHAGGPYRCPNVRIRARATRTNTPPNGAFRGFGAPQTEFAAETHLNRIAGALGISPLEIRRRNVYVVGDTTPTGQVLRRQRRRRGGPRAGGRGGRVRAPAGAPRRRPVATGRGRDRAGLAVADGSGAAGQRGRPGAGLARRRVHRLRRGPPGFRGLARAERRGRDRRADRARPRWARAPRRSSRSSSPRRSASRTRRSRSRRRTPRSSPIRGRPSRRGPRWSSVAC